MTVVTDVPEAGAAALDETMALFPNDMFAVNPRLSPINEAIDSLENEALAIDANASPVNLPMDSPEGQTVAVTVNEPPFDEAIDFSGNNKIGPTATAPPIYEPADIPGGRTVAVAASQSPIDEAIDLPGSEMPGLATATPPVNVPVDFLEHEKLSFTATTSHGPDVRADDHSITMDRPSPVLTADPSCSMITEDEKTAIECLAPSTAHVWYGPDKPEGALTTPQTPPNDPASPEPAPSQAKSQRIRRRMKVPLAPASLPDPDRDLNEEQIRLVCAQLPRVRQKYGQYFSAAGLIRAAWSQALLKRGPDGEMLLPEDVLRSCMPKWKARLESLKSEESPRSHTRKRHERESSTAEGPDNGSSSAKKAKRLHRDAEKTSDVETAPSQNILSRKKPMIRIRADTSRLGESNKGNAVETDACRAAEVRVRDPGRVSKSEARKILDSGAGRPSVKRSAMGNALSEQYNLFTHRVKFHRLPPTDSQSADQIAPPAPAGHSKLLDPKYLKSFNDFLTQEIHHMDDTILQIEHDPATRGQADTLRNHWHALVNLRDSCTRIEMTSASHTKE
ncbi:Uncharacterized protein PECH_004173 [Penicillium ucsense]|uniref:Uncharacterized protein n=1 Tax=Penicillium ucsense TaxID=2839758 RepID=A0A8J8WAD7_9EURO|nr:Uncharacterized protein PECM_005580 [Penicillium ucsense]KAF7737255.1 Uncharacterized protein PECH_004173 [Penicillium ucsense]